MLIEEAARPYNALAIQYSCAGYSPQTSAMWDSRVVTIQSASGGGRAAFRQNDLIPIVAMWSF